MSDRIDQQVDELIAQGVKPITAHRLGELVRAQPELARGDGLSSLFTSQMGKLKAARELGPCQESLDILQSASLEMAASMARVTAIMEQVTAIIEAGK